MFPRDTVLILDRLGLTKTGQGARVEAIARGIPVLIVPGTLQFHVSDF
jgi:hypothetical protein